MWDCTTGALRHAIDTGHVSGVDHVAAGPAGAWLATTGLDADPMVRIWDAATGALRHVIHTDHPEGADQVVVDPGGTWLATTGVGADPMVRIWDPGTGQLRHTLRADDPRGIRHLTAAADGSWLLTAGLGSIQLWTPDGGCLAAMRVDGDINQCVALADGSGVALAGSNGYVFDLR